MHTFADPRRGARWILALAALVVALGACAGGSGATDRGEPLPTSLPTSLPTLPSGAQRPNIVLLMTDDMALDEMRYLPQTRQLLGRTGVTFDHFAAPQPLCCPSRAQMLTGQYAQNNGVRHNTGPDGGYQAFHPDTALPVWLQDAGYQTAMVGKYLNGYPVHHASEVGWTHWDPTIEHIYNYFGYTQYADGAYTKPAEYHTDYVAQQSEQLIGQMSAAGQPFFLWSSFVAPHGVCRLKDEATNCYHAPKPAPKYAQSTHEKGLALRSPSFNEKDVSDKPHYISKRPFVSPARMQRLSMKRADALLSVDDAVAGIVASLKDAGQLDNTLIVLTSDNGYLLGQHRYEGKILGYEEAVRVPLLMSGLGLPQGVVDHQTYAMIDLAPTFAALAGASPLVPVDGVPIVVRNDLGHPTSDRTLLIQAGVTNLQRYPGGWWFRGVRTERYTYVAWTLGFRELYDRDRDPYELRNVAYDPRYAAVRAEMARRTSLLGSCSGDDCRTDFAAPPGPTARRGAPASRPVGGRA